MDNEVDDDGPAGLVDFPWWWVSPEWQVIGWIGLSVALFLGLAAVNYGRNDGNVVACLLAAAVGVGTAALAWVRFVHLRRDRGEG